MTSSDNKTVITKEVAFCQYGGKTYKALLLPPLLTYKGPNMGFYGYGNEVIPAYHAIYLVNLTPKSLVIFDNTGDTVEFHIPHSGHVAQNDVHFPFSKDKKVNRHGEYSLDTSTNHKGYSPYAITTKPFEYGKVSNLPPEPRSLRPFINVFFIVTPEVFSYRPHHPLLYSVGEPVHDDNESVIGYRGLMK
jgi:hypothetical protein